MNLPPTPPATCHWHCGDLTEGHEHWSVLVRENGKLLGRMTSDGGTTRNVMYAAPMSLERADKITADINAGNALVPGLTAKAIRF